MMDLAIGTPPICGAYLRCRCLLVHGQLLVVVPRWLLVLMVLVLDGAMVMGLIVRGAMVLVDIWVMELDVR
jgi:hypothetical protein